MRFNIHLPPDEKKILFQFVDNIKKYRPLTDFPDPGKMKTREEFANYNYVIRPLKIKARSDNLHAVGSFKSLYVWNLVTLGNKRATKRLHTGN